MRFMRMAIQAFLAGSEKNQNTFKILKSTFVAKSQEWPLFWFLVVISFENRASFKNISVVSCGIA